uniref:Guanylate cyclase n=1 Tax=Paramormyrops kingsleyae TaxID=1676925 RepID=A0A3B3RN14_9TELE
MPSRTDSCFLISLSNHPRWQLGAIATRRRKKDGTRVSPTDDDPFATMFSPSLHTRSWCSSWMFILLLMAAYVPCAWSTTYKIAIVGPWRCDPFFSKALPDLAAQLAMSRINKDPHLSRGYWYDYILVNEDCQSSRALARFTELQAYASAFLGPANPGYCSSAALLAKNWNKGLMSWSCLKPNMEGGSYPSFLRSLPLSSHVLFAVLRFFRWAHVAVVTSGEELWVATGQELASSLRALGLPVGIVVTIKADAEGPRKALQKIRNTDQVKVVIMCMHSVLIGADTQHALLTTALDMRMVDRGYIFIPYDTLLYALPYKDVSYPALANDSKLRQAYDAVLTVTMDSGDRNFYEAFGDAQESMEIRSSLAPQEVSPFFGTIYSMLYFLAMSVEQTRMAAGRWVSGELLAQSPGGFEIPGFNQPLFAGAEGEGMLAHYVVLDTDGEGTSLAATHALDAAHTHGKFGGLKYLGRPIHFAGRTPSSDAHCWFSPYIACGGGEAGAAPLVTGCFILCSRLYLLAVGHAVAPRKVVQLGVGLAGGGGAPTKLILTLDDLVFINTHVSKKKLNEDTAARSTLDVRTPQHSVSGRSYIASTPETSNIGILEGDWVWLKKFPNGDSVVEVKESTQAVFIKLRDMRHENLNLLLGLFFDGGVFGVVMEHCTRGSLEDLLNNEDMRLDWMFKSSLLTDLIRGMKYLHHRNIVHGRLKSRNCVVDGRFVLKVGEYGFNEITRAQGLVTPESRPEELLWTAPELLRNPALEKKGTYKGDIYSFAIIMQEVISRNSPFCMLDVPVKEIIEKVRSPPPLCRPAVSMDEAPLECIQIMKKSWSEEPERRPTFEEVFIEFKSINKGKKTNIIDSMLRMLEQYSSNLEDLIRERTEELEVERTKTENLVAQMLPRSVALALKTGKPVKPEYFKEVTLYFSDIVGFTTISALSEPIEVVDLLNDLYTLFDAIIGQHDVYKVETIGDAYMVASGVPNRNGSQHAAEVSNMSLDILHCIGAFKMRHMPNVKVKIRIGLHSGSVVAGVVGLTMPRYCLFGDTVNTASRMESTGLPYRIHVNQTTVEILHSLQLGYRLEIRGKTELKGKGIEDTYWLVGRADSIPADRRQRFLDRQKTMK